MNISRRSVCAGVLATASLSGFAQAASGQSPPVRLNFDSLFDYSRARNGVSVAVFDAAGTVLAEDYPSPGGLSEGWELASGTKSFCGVALAAAVQDGLLRVDQPCADILSEWRGDSRRAITIRHLLSLTSGLSGGNLGRPPPYAEAIAARPDGAPSARFAYGPVPFQVFGEILRRVTGGDPLAYYQRRLFDPLAIAPKRWRRGADAMPHLPSGAAFTARDWGRFGVMTLNGWRKDGRALVDPAALAANFDPSQANPGYGLTWWLLRPGLIGPSPRAGLSAEALGQEALQEDIVMAAGAGNQRLYLLRKRGLVIVRQANRVGMAMLGRGAQWSDRDFLSGLLT